MFNHIHQALGQVEELKARVIARRLFSGYSGLARVMGGIVALAGSVIMASSSFPKSTSAHLIGWGVVFFLALSINYSALLRWVLITKGNLLGSSRLHPLLYPLPPLVVGAVLTVALIQADSHHLLFGTWMCLFGLVNLSSRGVLSNEIVYVGWYYLASGSLLLLFFPELSFTHPWPMGVVFFVGEAAGGYVFYLTSVTSRGSSEPEACRSLLRRVGANFGIKEE